MTTKDLRFSETALPFCKAFLTKTSLATDGDRLLISGDLSGIQAFIFNIATDGKVARALKGRSV
jgi:hypothetical protein